MKKAALYSLKNVVSHLVKQDDPNEYLSELRKNFERKIKEQDIHEFRIVDVRQKGFVVKIYGLFGYVSFFHMPWKYRNSIIWQTMFPNLKNHIFLGKIHDYNSKSLGIKIDAKCMAFADVNIPVDEYYQSIVLNVVTFGVFVEIGHLFDWRFGSVSGLLHKDNFTSPADMDSLNTGDVLQVIYWGENSDSQHMFGLMPELKPWFDGSVKKLIGKKVKGKVLSNKNGNLLCSVNDIFKAKITVKKSIYPQNSNRVKKALKQVYNDEELSFLVYDLDHKNHRLSLKWEDEQEIRLMIDRGKRKKRNQPIPGIQHLDAIHDKLDKGTAEILQLVGKEINVAVVKTKEPDSSTTVKYVVNSKFSATLVISNKSRKISNFEKNIIQNNLQDGDILPCTVTGFRNKEIVVTWQITDVELSAFLQS